MARVNIEVFSSAGESLFWAPPPKAAQMVASGAATWINQGWGRLCLRLTALPEPGPHRNASALNQDDTEAVSGLRSIVEERRSRHRMNAWKEVTS